MDLPIRDLVLPEYDREMATTRRLLDRAPEDRFAWKPHPKSMSLGQLVTHLADIPGWVGTLLDGSGYDLSTAGSEGLLVPAASRADLMQRFDSHVDAARGKIVSTADGAFMALWTLKKDGQEIFTAPRLSVLRNFLLNHTIHHRGQLTVYLRLLEVPLPAIYGPTADETG
jgi:uncharacterized damage-inducible protein DinB